MTASFTAGITFTTGEVVTLDVISLDEHGIRGKSDEGERTVPWADVSAVMLATPDHMLENAGYMFSVAQVMQETEQREPYDAAQMRRLGVSLLREAAPMLCPQGGGCPLGGGGGDEGARLRERVAETVRRRGLLRLPEPVVLASGELSADFVDAKAALAAGEDLAVACRALLHHVGDVEFDAVGGLTMGADQFAHVAAVLARKEWFVVRKEPKGRGTDRLVEGARVGPGTRVLLVDDVVTTGGSIQKAYEALVALGATVVAAATLVDRGDVARRFFEERGVPYVPLVTYRELGIEPLRGGAGPA